MKTLSVYKKLGHFRTHQAGNAMYFTSRAQDKRFVKVWEQENGRCVALPMIVQDGNEVVAFHPKTVKSLLEFMEG